MSDQTPPEVQPRPKLPMPAATKEGILAQVAEWLEEPGDSSQLTIEIQAGADPKTRQPGRLFFVYVKGHLGHAFVPHEVSSIVRAAQAGMPKMGPR